MDVIHEEAIQLVELDDVLDKIQDIYGYITGRSNTEIRFVIENSLIVLTLDGLYVNVYYRSPDIFFDRSCSKCEIRILDDDSINLRCYNGDKTVFLSKII